MFTHTPGSLRTSSWHSVLVVLHACTDGVALHLLIVYGAVEVELTRPGIRESGRCEQVARDYST